MLKSPVMINSWGVVAANERKKTEVIEENREWFGISGRGWRTIGLDIEH